MYANRWTRPDISPISGMVNVIVGIPTGFIISRDTIEWMYASKIPGLQRVRFYNQQLITFFSHVCINESFTMCNVFIFIVAHKAPIGCCVLT